MGCWQVFADRRHRVDARLQGQDGRDRRAPALTDGIFMAMTLANVGLDLARTSSWSTTRRAEHARLLSSGEVDAVVAFPPVSTDLRAKGIGQGGAQLHDRPALVELLLLHGRGQPELDGEAPGGHQAGAAGGAQGRRRRRQGPRRVRPLHGRPRLHHQLRLRLRHPEGDALRRLAGLRPRSTACGSTPCA